MLKTLNLYVYRLIFASCLVIPSFYSHSAYLLDPPDIDAKAWVLMSYNTGQIIAGDNLHKPLAPASLTKIMTTFVVGEEIKAGNIQLSDMVTISENAWGKKFPGSSKMFLNVGDSVSVEDLLRGVIVSSGNDATVALSEHVAGHQNAFIKMMNQYAERYGMKDSYFTNPHGLDSDNQTTSAFDMAILTRAFIQEVPDIYGMHKEKSFTFGDIKQGNRNALLWDETLHVDGVKTGYTKQAGYSLVSSAKNGEQRLIAVVLGTKSAKARRLESKQLLSWGFRFYEDITPQLDDKLLEPIRIWHGEPASAELTLGDAGMITVPSRLKNKLKPIITYRENLAPPLEKGQQVGKIDWYINEQLLVSQPILTQGEILKAPWYNSAIDSVLQPIYTWLNKYGLTKQREQLQARDIVQPMSQQ
ncbi:TPA: serine hydrolase [Photobacterium damselae]